MTNGMRKFSLMGSIVIAGLLASAVAHAEPEAAPARALKPVQKGSCATTEANFSTATQQVSTTSTNLVPVRDSFVVINVSGVGQQCVIVTFSAEANSPNEEMDVSATLDGVNNVLSPIFFSANQLFQVRSFTWVFESVSPGKHRVAIEFRSRNGGQVNLYYRSLVALH